MSVGPSILQENSLSSHGHSDMAFDPTRRSGAGSK